MPSGEREHRQGAIESERRKIGKKE